MMAKRQTIVEKYFGEGRRIKDLSEEERIKLNWYYNKERLARMPEEERKEYYKNTMKRYKKNSLERYREYQREYRRNRVASDPEFAKRVRKHSKTYTDKMKNAD